MNTQKLNSAIAEFTKKKKSNAAYYEENWTERKERKKYYQAFTKDKLLIMTEEEFFPYLFSEFDIDNTFEEKEISAKLGLESITINRFNLFTYKKVSNLDEHTKKAIVSLTNIINEWDTISVKYNIEEIEKTITESEIKYIDITSVIKTLKLRNDLILQFEILLQRIGRKCNVKFSVEESQLQALDEIFPFIFESAIELEGKDTLDGQLYQLLSLHNLRDIKRKIEDIVFAEFFDQYKTHNSSDII